MRISAYHMPPAIKKARRFGGLALVLRSADVVGSARLALMMDERRITTIKIAHPFGMEAQAEVDVVVGDRKCPFVESADGLKLVSLDSQTRAGDGHPGASGHDIGICGSGLRIESTP